ncbi:MAG: LexA family protein [Candidatus Fimivivens sp.]
MTLKELRTRRGLTQADVARELGLSRASYTNIENGKRGLEASQIAKLSEILNCSADEIVGRKAPRTTMEKGIKIPVLGYVRAGIPVEAVQEILDYEEITVEMASTGDFFGLKVHGDSMSPMLFDGDIVIVRQQPCIDTGDIGVVLVNGGDATVKKVKVLDEGIMLIPINQNYETMFFNKKEINTLPINVVGKVVELRRSFH